jgi:hypothetical protein
MLEAVSLQRQDHVRHRALLLALFNTGAHAQQLLDIRASDLRQAIYNWADPPLFVCATAHEFAFATLRQ